MRLIYKRLIVVLACILFICTLSSCGIKDSDGKVAKDSVINLISYIEEKDTINIKKMFAPVTVDKVFDLDNQIIELCNVFSGNYKSISDNGLGTTESIENGIKEKTFDMLYTVYTTNSEYYFSILWQVVDDKDSNNIGIWSLYIELSEDDNNPTPHDVWVDGISLI